MPEKSGMAPCVTLSGADAAFCPSAGVPAANAAHNRTYHRIRIVVLPAWLLDYIRLWMRVREAVSHLGDGEPGAEAVAENQARVEAGATAARLLV